MGRAGWTLLPQLPLAAGHSPSPFPLFKRNWDPSRLLSPNTRPSPPPCPSQPLSPLLGLTLGERVPYLNKDALRNHPGAEGCSELPVPQSRTRISGWGQLSPVCPSRRALSPGVPSALLCAGSAAASPPVLPVHSCLLLSPRSLRAPRCPPVLPEPPGRFCALHKLRSLQCSPIAPMPPGAAKATGIPPAHPGIPSRYPR